MFFDNGGVYNIRDEWDYLLYRDDDELIKNYSIAMDAHRAHPVNSYVS